MTGSSGHRRVPDTFYKSLQIPVPKDKKDQKHLLNQIRECKMKIQLSKETILSIPEKKRNILNSYLMGSENSKDVIEMVADKNAKYN